MLVMVPLAISSNLAMILLVPCAIRIGSTVGQICCSAVPQRYDLLWGQFHTGSTERSFTLVITAQEYIALCKMGKDHSYLDMYNSAVSRVASVRSPVLAVTVFAYLTKAVS